MKNLIGTVATATLLSGCVTTFTSIEPREDGSYTLTRVKQGVFYIGSSVYHCTASEDSLSCETINSGPDSRKGHR